jgi:hypothetical protein
MNLHKSIPLDFAGTHYEIRVYYDDREINVLAFKDKRPVNGFRHIAKLPKRVDPEKFLNKYLPSELIDACKADITENKWEPVAKALAEAGKA